MIADVSRLGKLVEPSDIEPGASYERVNRRSGTNHITATAT
jgi:hypothetical protein